MSDALVPASPLRRITVMVIGLLPLIPFAIIVPLAFAFGAAMGAPAAVLLILVPMLTWLAVLWQLHRRPLLAPLLLLLLGISIMAWLVPSLIYLIRPEQFTPTGSALRVGMLALVIGAVVLAWMRPSRWLAAAAILGVVAVTIGAFNIGPGPDLSVVGIAGAALLIASAFWVRPQPAPDVA